MVQRFMCAPGPDITFHRLLLHPLDVHRRSMLHGPQWAMRLDPDVPDTDNIRLAVELRAAGIRFKKTNIYDNLHNIRFRHGVLRLPVLSVDDSTESVLLNMMAFERLHVGAGNEVTEYVIFMGNIIDSAKDVVLLRSQGIIQNTLGTTTQAVADMFNSIAKDGVLDPDSALRGVHRQLNAYCRHPWRRLRARVILADTYFKNNPWAIFSLATVVVALAATIMQTVYTVLQFYRDN